MFPFQCSPATQTQVPRSLFGRTACWHRHSPTTFPSCPCKPSAGVLPRRLWAPGGPLAGPAVGVDIRRTVKRCKKRRNSVGQWETCFQHFQACCRCGQARHCAPRAGPPVSSCRRARTPRSARGRASVPCAGGMAVRDGRGLGWSEGAGGLGAATSGSAPARPRLVKLHLHLQLCTQTCYSTACMCCPAPTPHHSCSCM